MLTSLYIHIPFCNQICTYCDFHKEMATVSKKEKYIDALCKEIRFHKDKYTTLETIYIGGGTPSSLDYSLLKKLLQTIEACVDLESIKEYSIETNPNDLNEEFIQIITNHNINRVSVGVQTFDQKQLLFLGRTHNLDDIKNGIKLLKEGGIGNISVDMIFSLVDQTIKQLEYDLIETVKLDVNHISYYSLILEEKTKLFYLYEQDKVSMNTEDLEGLMYNKVISYLTGNGYSHYEISNFCKGDKESLHNKTYWLNKEYLGLGSGSHSMYRNKRFNNPRNVSKYIETINNGIYDNYLYYPYESLSDELMLGLRLLQGIHIEEINKKYSIKLFNKYPELNNFIKNGILEISDGYLRFTKIGILLGNEVFQVFVEVL